MRKSVFTQCFPGIGKFGDGVCRQEFQKMCDMDEILKAFRVTGVLPNVHGIASLPCDVFLYGDYSENVANVISEEVNKDVIEVVHSDGDPAKGSSEASSSVEEKVSGVKGSETPEADA